MRAAVARESSYNPRWLHQHETKVGFFRWLVDELQYEAKQLLAAVDEPWKWEAEYRLYCCHRDGPMFLAQCDECGKRCRFASADKIDWENGSTLHICGAINGTDLASDEFCDTYLRVLSMERPEPVVNYEVPDA